jgi:murein DD-endopeptidase MepM/ murein hydrolase activator NlpD
VFFSTGGLKANAYGTAEITISSIEKPSTTTSVTVVVLCPPIASDLIISSNYGHIMHPIPGIFQLHSSVDMYPKDRKDKKY